MNIEFVFTVLAGAIASLGIGWWFGSRIMEARIEVARAEGRSESSIEIARLQERADLLEGKGQQLDQERTLLDEKLQASERRAVSAETDFARAQERNAGVSANVLRLTNRNSELEQIVEGLRNQVAERDGQLGQLRELVGASRAELDGVVATRDGLVTRSAELAQECAALQTQISELKVANAQLETTVASERTSAQERVNLLAAVRADMVAQFKSTSSDIFDEKSRIFTEQSTSALSQVLEPVRIKLGEFHAKVEEVYRTEGQERSALGEQLKQLIQLNQTLSTDAHNLTRALKGDQRTQGTWGEFVLDTVLEQAGLVEGTHYERQSSFVSEDERRAVPDIVLRLPGDRQLVIDSKVSLTAYERSASAICAEEREIYLKQHVTSLRNHIRSLSEKNYQQLYELKSLDFVVLFVPLEPAFVAAVGSDNQIYREAWDRNVLLVSPSTLLFVVRTIAYLWRQESQARNVVEIAKRGAALYDKLCGFVEDLSDVGKRITQTGKAYDAAMRKLAVGDGNVIRQAEMLRDLGVKPSKQLPMQLVDRALSNVQHNLISDAQGDDLSDGEVLQGERGAADEAVRRDGARA